MKRDRLHADTISDCREAVIAAGPYADVSKNPQVLEANGHHRNGLAAAGWRERISETLQTCMHGTVIAHPPGAEFASKGRR